MKTTRSSHCEAGLTLIEVLVIAFALAALAGMLLPALPASKRHATKVSCVNCISAKLTFYASRAGPRAWDGKSAGVGRTFYAYPPPEPQDGWGQVGSPPSPRPSPRGEGETPPASWRYGSDGLEMVQGGNARMDRGNPSGNLGPAGGGFQLLTSSNFFYQVGPTVRVANHPTAP